MKLKLPSKAEMRERIPSNDKLEELFFKGYHSKRKIELMQISIKQREEKIRQLNKTTIMKRFNLHHLMISNTENHIRAEYKKFKRLFDI